MCSRPVTKINVNSKRNGKVLRINSKSLIEASGKIPNDSQFNTQASAVIPPEEERQKFKVDSKDMTEALERFSGELSDLVIRFAQIARVPVTIGNP
jgi:hypothetical protein